jgi:hypothetical protein
MPSKLTVMLVTLLLATPAVIFWLWLVIVPARVAIPCPEECQCNIGGYEVSCKGAVSFIRLTNVRVLEFVKNNIKLIEKHSFVSLTELKVLRVKWCGLRTIQLGAFNGLTKLTELSIEGNEISEIIAGTFQNLRNLERLALKHNELHHLDSDVFSGLVYLRYISLAANKLQYLHPDTFLALPNIKHINLYNNPALQIPTDRNFITSHSLSHLDISDCNVSTLSVETFTNVSALEHLDLSYNKLRTVHINILTALPKLSDLSLFGNRLQCDCQLLEVWRWCEDRNIQTGYVECDTASEVEGMWWGVLKKGECLEGNVQYYGDNNTRYSYTDNDTYTDTKTDKDTKQNGDDSSFLSKYQAPIYVIPFIFGITGNAILLIIIVCNKDMRTLPNMYILNLAVSDIIYLTVLFNEAVANRISDMLLQGDFMCKFFPFCRRLSVGLSAYSIAVLSIQRYRVTVNPFHVLVFSPSTWRIILTTICGVWFVAALFAVPSALSNYLCSDSHPGINMPYYKRVVIFELLVSCVLPLCVIAYTYIMTARHLVESSRSLSEGTQNPILKTRRNTARILIGLTVVFLISYLPYHAFWIYIIYTDEGDIYYKRITDIILASINKLHHPYLISTCLLLINSCLNPVALFCTSSPFRQHLRRYLTCFCKTNSPPTDLEITRRN